MAGAEQLYVYGVTSAALPCEFGNTCMSGQEQPVFTVACQELAAVVSRVENEPLPLRNQLLAHEQVVERVLQTQTVIPFSFGNVFARAEDVEQLLERLYEPLRTVYAALENKIEVGLKLFARQDWLQGEIAKHPHLQALQKKVNAETTAGAFYEQIALGEAAQTFFLGLQRQFVDEIYTPLAELAGAAKANEPTGERMLLNAAFLIDRDQEAAFDQRVNQLHERFSAQVEFQYTGPWPAYNFVTVRMKGRGRDVT